MDAGMKKFSMAHALCLIFGVSDRARVQCRFRGAAAPLY
jgi:hypothetical protein